MKEYFRAVGRELRALWRLTMRTLANTITVGTLAKSRMLPPQPQGDGSRRQLDQIGVDRLRAQ
jgi:hypothetical protein